MNSNEIRQQFINFFIDKGHVFVPSASVVPADDPTLLFTNAGMNQFKDVFLNQSQRSYNRAVNSQKCIRVSGKHNDLEEVGHDTYHHTFFEMLGNWSFGDYYKKEAIVWAWQLLTEVWKLPKERLYATVFGGDKKDGLEADKEAERLWKENTDMDPNHVLKYGKKDNFWEMGSSGPCGPCSEIHIDLTEDLSGAGQVNGDSAQVIEIWNLVFIQYNRDINGKLSTLPNKHVDTGAGFERIVAILQNKKSNYDTDIFTPLLVAIGKIASKKYEDSTEQIAFRVIADHIRMLTFSIADGGLPSNEGRGYVIRRILRRAARYGRNLNLHEPFLYRLVDDVIKNMGNAYPEINERKTHIQNVIKTEEENFNKTLDRGLEIFTKIEKELRKQNKTTIPGSEIFRLYDTFGFPLDLTAVMAAEKGLAVDNEGFEREMSQQKERARTSAKFSAQQVNSEKWIALSANEDSEFVGYEKNVVETEISHYIKEDDKILIRLLKTPFYAESGGQVGDTGTITGQGFTLKVLDTQKEGETIIHYCEGDGNFDPARPVVKAKINIINRNRTIKNHTATHLLQAALQKILGDHVHQQGSLVEPDRLRFDFTHYEKISPQQLQHIESLVNDEIQKDTHLEIAYKNIDEAKAQGAMALFGEKYGEIVRTVKIADFSLELCGGTHVNGTGEIGPFFITSEEAIASGVRRIEAVTGPGAVNFSQSAISKVNEISRLLNGPEEGVVAKVEEMLIERKNLEKEISKIKSTTLLDNVQDIINSATEKNGVNIIIHKLQNADTKSLKELADKIREKAKNSLGIIASINDDKLAFVVFVSDNLITKYKAGDLIKKVALVAGGGGGGQPHLATAGARDIDKLDDALKTFSELI